MSARSEYRTARAKLEAGAIVTVSVTVKAPDGTSVTEAWPDTWRGEALHDVTYSGLIMDEVCELATCAGERLQQEVLGSEPPPTAEEAAEDDARRVAREAEHIARCRELSIEADDRRAAFEALKASLGR
jgi:hypothetical protein